MSTFIPPLEKMAALMTNSYYESSSNTVSPSDLKYNRYALVGFIISLFWFWGIASLIGLIVSFIGYKKSKLAPAKGNELALAGMVLGALGIVSTLGLIGIIIFLNL